MTGLRIAELEVALKAVGIAATKEQLAGVKTELHSVEKQTVKTDYSIKDLGKTIKFLKGGIVGGIAIGFAKELFDTAMAAENANAELKRNIENVKELQTEWKQLKEELGAYIVAAVSWFKEYGDTVEDRQKAINQLVAEGKAITLDAVAALQLYYEEQRKIGDMNIKNAADKKGFDEEEIKRHETTIELIQIANEKIKTQRDQLEADRQKIADRSTKDLDSEISKIMNKIEVLNAQSETQKKLIEIDQEGESTKKRLIELADMEDGILDGQFKNQEKLNNALRFEEIQRMKNKDAIMAEANAQKTLSELTGGNVIGFNSRGGNVQNLSNVVLDPNNGKWVLPNKLSTR
jgi:hypothetical protein